MGLPLSIDYNKVPLDWLEVFKKMQFTRAEVKKIHDIFDKLDAKQKGGIDTVEWLTFLDLDRNNFTERVFCAFDKDGNKTIDFYEFVISLWKFCTLGEGAISKCMISLRSC
jgi:Ca2+-binding EF-hand superfamily protein